MTQHDEQLLRRFGERQIVEREIAPLQHLPVQKAQSRNPALHRAKRQLPLLQKMDLVMTQLVGTRAFGRFSIVFGKLAHSKDVAANRLGRIV